MIKLNKKNNTPSSKKTDKGFIALTSVVLITSILTLIIISISIQSIDETQISQAFEKSKQAQYDTQSCLNYMLLELSKNPNYQPSGRLEIENADYKIICDNTEISTVGENTTITASSQNNFYVDLIATIATTTTPLAISSFSIR